MSETLKHICKEKTMVKKRLSLVMLASALAFGLAVSGCAEDDGMDAVPPTPVNVQARMMPNGQINVAWHPAGGGGSYERYEVAVFTPFAEHSERSVGMTFGGIRDLNFRPTGTMATDPVLIIRVRTGSRRSPSESGDVVSPWSQPSNAVSSSQWNAHSFTNPSVNRSPQTPLGAVIVGWTPAAGAVRTMIESSIEGGAWVVVADTFHEIGTGGNVSLTVPLMMPGNVALPSPPFGVSFRITQFESDRGFGQWTPAFIQSSPSASFPVQHYMLP